MIYPLLMLVVVMVHDYDRIKMLDVLFFLSPVDGGGTMGRGRH